jgi:glycosyltransferase involved in cell wall biosynthesis
MPWRFRVHAAAGVGSRPPAAGLALSLPRDCAEIGAVKVLLLTPTPTETYRGSAATVFRYREGLQRRGHLCEIFGATGEGELKQSLEGAIELFKPDLVHAHDAFRCGMPLLGLRLPWVVSISGEDCHRQMQEHKLGAVVCETLRRARRVLVPSDAYARQVEQWVPDTVGKLDVVPRAPRSLPTDGTDLRRSLGIPRHRFLILLPGGIRPIKGQHRALSLVHTLRVNGVDAEMIIVGPEQDQDYYAELRQLTDQHEGVRLLPALSPARMGAAYKDADVVLNTSFHEGMSPVVLEAGILGRPVVASNVPGNTDVIRHKETGLLFQDEEEMARHVLVLHKNRSAAGALGLRLREDIKRRFDPQQEIDSLLSAYAAA